MLTHSAAVDALLVASAVPVSASHRSGTLDEARALLQADPLLAEQSIYTAAVLGNAPAVRQWIERDPALATARGGPYDWDALTWCCFSRWLRDEPARAEDFVAVARTLIDAGAPVNTGFMDVAHGPTPQFESALYGAAGVAFCAPLTALLLAHGADPNDDEVPYHAAEHYAHDVVEALLTAPVPLSRDSLATLLLRKADWHDLHGVQQLLQHGADPNHPGPWPHSPLLQAIRRDNHVAIIETLLDAGADAARTFNGVSAASLAAWHGRTDVLQLFAARGVELPQEGLDGIAVDVAFGDVIGVRARLAADGDLRAAFMERLPEFMGRCAGNDSLAPLSVLLQLAPSPDVRWAAGDGYWQIPPNSSALEVARLRKQAAAERLIREFAAGAE
jgi:ankyrin repeat protein